MFTDIKTNSELITHSMMSQNPGVLVKSQHADNELDGDGDMVRGIEKPAKIKMEWPSASPM